MSRRLAGLSDRRPPPQAAVRRRRPGAGPDETAEVVAAVVQVAALLRSGAHPAQAWSEGLGAAAPGGMPSADHLDQRWPRATSATAAVLAAARLTARLGVGAAPVLDQVAAGLAQDADAATQRRAALAGPVATARLLAWLPAGGLVLGAVLGAAPWTVLLDGGTGTVVLLAGGLLMLAGRRWTSREVAVARTAAR